VHCHAAECSGDYRANQAVGPGLDGFTLIFSSGNYDSLTALYCTHAGPHGHHLRGVPEVHFIVTSPSIRPSPATRGMYQLSCRFGRHEASEFRKETMRPYRVEDTVFQTGFAEEGEYEII
jgi:hypothetical protein